MKYIVEKEYAGIEKGTEIEQKKKHISDEMVERGYWKPLKKIEPKVESRQKKVEPTLHRKKK